MDSMWISDAVQCDACLQLELYGFGLVQAE